MQSPAGQNATPLMSQVGQRCWPDLKVDLTPKLVYADFVGSMVVSVYFWQWGSELSVSCRLSFAVLSFALFLFSGAL